MEFLSTNRPEGRRDLGFPLLIVGTAGAVLSGAMTATYASTTLEYLPTIAHVLSVSVAWVRRDILFRG